MAERHHSAGVIPYRVTDEDELEVLVLYARTNDWEFPKGSVEEGEELQQAAIREFAEETGFNDIRLVDGFSDEYSYEFTFKGTDIYKTVYMFIGYVFDEDQSPDLSKEHSEYEWVTVDEARSRIYHDGPRGVLERGVRHLRNNTVYPFD